MRARRSARGLSGTAADPHRPLRLARSSPSSSSPSGRRPGCWSPAPRTLPRPGSFRRIDATGSPLLLVRGEDDVLRAFFNTCQHRGAPVVREACGIARRLRCQYHSWTYDLDGNAGRRARPPRLHGAGRIEARARAGALRDPRRLGVRERRPGRDRRSASGWGRSPRNGLRSTAPRFAPPEPVASASTRTGRSWPTPSSRPTTSAPSIR